MNDHILERLTSPEYLVVFVLLVIIVISFARYLWRGDDDTKMLQKLIGGLGVFVIAILASNAWVYSVSVLVGGLIIASENFMMFIAAVMRSRGDKVPDTVRAFHFEKASEAEIEAKTKDEMDDGTVVSNKQIPSVPEYEDMQQNYSIQATTEPRYKKTENEQANRKLLKRRNIELQLQTILHNEYGDRYEPHVKLVAQEKQVILDGIIRNKRGSVSSVVEIKYVTPQSFPNLKFIIKRFQTKLRKHNFHKKILVCVVSEHITPEDASKIRFETETLAEMRFFEYRSDTLTEVHPLDDFSLWT